MLTFKQFTYLTEAKVNDVLAKYPHLQSFGLPQNHISSYGMHLGKITSPSDDPQKVRDTVAQFDSMKNRLPSGEDRDITRYPSLNHISDKLQPYIEKSEKQKQQKSKELEGEEVLHDDTAGTVVKEIHTHEAASRSLYCDRTEWCVSRKGQTGKDHFSSYGSRAGTNKKGKARLFVIHTPDSKMYAYHEGERNIVRDQKDKGIHISNLSLIHI